MVRDLEIDHGYLRHVVDRLTSVGSSPLGFRNTGTVEDAAVAEFVSGEFHAMGMVDVAIEEVDVDAWRFRSATVSARAGEFLTTSVSFDYWSFEGVSATPPDGITGRLVVQGLRHVAADRQAPSLCNDAVPRCCADDVLGPEHRREGTPQAHIGCQRCRQPAGGGARVDHGLRTGPVRGGRDSRDRRTRGRRQEPGRLRRPRGHPAGCRDHGRQLAREAHRLHRDTTKVATKQTVTRDKAVWGANRSVRRIALITCDDDDGYRADGHRVSNFVAIAEAR